MEALSPFRSFPHLKNVAFLVRKQPTFASDRATNRGAPLGVPQLDARGELRRGGLLLDHGPQGVAPAENFPVVGQGLDALLDDEMPLRGDLDRRPAVAGPRLAMPVAVPRRRRPRVADPVQVARLEHARVDPAADRGGRLPLPQSGPPRRLQQGPLDVDSIEHLGADQLPERERRRIQTVVPGPLGRRLDGIALLLERGDGVGIPAVGPGLRGSRLRLRLRFRFRFLAPCGQSLEEGINRLRDRADSPPWCARPGPGLAVRPGRGRDHALDLLDRAVGLEAADPDLEVGQLGEVIDPRLRPAPLLGPGLGQLLEQTLAVVHDEEPVIAPGRTTRPARPGSRRRRASPAIPRRAPRRLPGRSANGRPAPGPVRSRCPRRPRGVARTPIGGAPHPSASSPSPCRSAASRPARSPPARSRP